MPGYFGAAKQAPLLTQTALPGDVSGCQGAGFPQRRVLRDWAAHHSRPSGLLWMLSWLGMKGFFVLWRVALWDCTWSVSWGVEGLGWAGEAADAAACLGWTLATLRRLGH